MFLIHYYITNITINAKILYIIKLYIYITYITNNFIIIIAISKSVFSLNCLLYIFPFQ